MKTNGFEMIKASEMTKERVNPNIYYINYTYNAIEYYTPMDSTYKFDDDFEFPEEIDYGKLGYRRMVHGEDILDEFYLEEESEKQRILKEERRVQKLKKARLKREGLLPLSKEEKLNDLYDEIGDILIYIFYTIMLICFLIVLSIPFR
jgi:hypothetical protein